MREVHLQQEHADRTVGGQTRQCITNTNSSLLLQEGIAHKPKESLTIHWRHWPLLITRRNRNFERISVEATKHEILYHLWRLFEITAWSGWKDIVPISELSVDREVGKGVTDALPPNQNYCVRASSREKIKKFVKKLIDDFIRGRLGTDRLLLVFHSF